ncbi:MAG: T9SS type A sorting domain-containing protein [Bacteroidia bacterium]|nr:T9SS type A sorting domain-containing protein [Bacteroidia bacterium]
MKKIYLFAIIFIYTTLSAQNCLDFDGTNDYVDCGNDTSLQISGKYITLEAWIYPTAWKTNTFEGNIIAKEYNTSNYGYMLRCGAGGKLNFALGDGTWHEITTTNTVLSLNTWQHVAGTFDGNKMRLYLNGVLIDSLAFNGSISKTTANNLYLGAHVTYSRFYQGQIDEVKIWSICKTENEIANGLSDELCSSQTGLRAYYKFNLGKASQNNPNVKKLNDLSGYGNTGTLTNFGLNGSNSNWIKGKTLTKGVFDASDTIDVCNGYISPSRKFTWSKSGTYYDTIPTYYGCDSAITIYLTIRKSTSFSFNAHACDSFISPSGKLIWKSSGVYSEKIKNIAGCDSTITVYLTIGGNKDTIYPVACNKYTVPSGKRTLLISGNYFDTLTDFRGCDSIIDIRLIIHKDQYASIDLSGCSKVAAPSGKRIYTAEGTYNDTLKTLSGCDSFLSVKVKLKNSSATVIASSCGSYKSPDDRNIWTKSGIYIDTLTNMAFCDSFITYNITIYESSSSSMQVQACRYYRSPSNKKTWTKTGTYTDTLVNAVGCDSVISIQLTIPTNDVGVTQNGKHLSAISFTGNFRWLDCNNNFSFITGANTRDFTAPAIGHYALEVTDSNCTDTSMCYFVNNVSILNSNKLETLIVSPNPNKGLIEIESPSLLNHAKLRIIDLSGRVVYEAYYDEFQKEQVLLQIAPGSYLLEILAEAYHAMSFISVE